MHMSVGSCRIPVATLCFPQTLLHTNFRFHYAPAEVSKTSPSITSCIQEENNFHHFKSALVGDMLVPRRVVVATSTATAKDLVTTSPAGVAVAADGSGMALDGFGPPFVW